MGIVLKNNATSTITTAINASDVGLAVAAGTGSLFPTLGVGDYFYATLVSAGGTYEVIKVTARVGDTMTIVRAQEGTTAQSFTSGSRIELRVTAASITDLVGEYDQASEISFTPTGTISSTNVQNAIAEVSGDVTAAAAALAATTGAALVGKTGGGTVQDAITTFNNIVRGDPAAPKWNLFIGTGAGAATTTAARSTAVGVNALAAQTTANLNTAFGSLTLQSATTGAVNSAFGADALSATTTGEYNDGFGCKALTNNVTGSRNKAFGQSALLYNNSGNDNCAFGQSALLVNFSGSRNCSFGNNSLTSNVSGVDNSAFGSNALYYNTASYNCAFGKDAMFTNGSGASNNAIGYQSLYSNTTGNNNAALGQGTLYGNTVGTDNTGLGHRAGYGAAGDEATTVDTYCTFIGSYASRSSAVPTATVLTNATAIGYNAKFTKSNQVSLGDNLVTEIRAPGPGFLASTTDFTLSKTSTAGGTTGAQTINKPAGSVNFAAAATSLVVTNSLVTANSVIIATVATNDSTMKSVAAVAGSGSFTLHANAAATAETRVSFLVIN